MKLIDYMHEYANQMGASPLYVEQMAYVIRWFQEFHRREFQIHELTVRAITEYIRAHRQKLEPATLRGRQNTLFRLALHAYKSNKLEKGPPRPHREDLDVIKGRHKPVRAWSVQQVKELLDVARELPGAYKIGVEEIEGLDRSLGWPWVSKRDFWVSYLLFRWDTGLRNVDVRRVERSMIAADGQLALTMHKTGRVIYCQLRPETIAAIDRALSRAPTRRYIWPCWAGKSTWTKTAQRLLRRAGLPYSVGKIRATAATAVENAHPQTGYQFLGNTPDVFYKHYYDPTQGRANRPLPPSLDCDEATDD